MNTPASDIDLDAILSDLPDDPLQRLRAINTLIGNDRADPRRRLQLCIEGYHLAEQLGESRSAATFLYAQGECYFSLSDYPAAFDRTRLADERYENLGYTAGVGWTQARLGSICIQTGEYVRAMAYLRRSLDIARQIGQREMETHTLTILGILHQRLGEYEEAISCFLRGLAIEEELGRTQGVAANLANLGWVSFELGDYDGALDYYCRGLGTFRETGWKYGQATTLHGIGDIHARRGDYTRALTSYRESLEIAIEIGSRQNESEAFAGIGSVLLEQGEIGEAGEALRRSLAIREEIGDERGGVQVSLDLAKLYVRQGEGGKSLDILSQALATAQSLNIAPVLASVHRALSEHYEQQGDSLRALEHYKEYHHTEIGINRSEVGTKTERLQAQLDLERLEKESAFARLKAERMESELNVARRVQMSLLPAEPPRIERLDIASICLPALEVGGDYFDFFPFDDNRLALAIGDITGKGIPAAIQMTLVKGVLLSHAKPGVAPKEVLREVNRHLYANFSRGWFASMIYATIDTERMLLDYASAGHNPPLVIRDGAVVSPERTRGMALGLVGTSVFASALSGYRIDLVAGDVIALYTDGYSEAMNVKQEEYGEERLIASAIRHRYLDRADSIIESIGGDIHAFIGNAEPHDDMTMVVVRVM